MIWRALSGNRRRCNYLWGNINLYLAGLYEIEFILFSKITFCFLFFGCFLWNSIGTYRQVNHMWDNWLISNSNVMKCPSGAFSFYIYILAAVQIFDQVTGAQMFGKHNLKLSNFNFITKSASLSNAFSDHHVLWHGLQITMAN